MVSEAIILVGIAGFVIGLALSLLAPRSVMWLIYPWFIIGVGLTSGKKFNWRFWRHNDD